MDHRRFHPTTTPTALSILSSHLLLAHPLPDEALGTAHLRFRIRRAPRYCILFPPLGIFVIYPTTSSPPPPSLPASFISFLSPYPTANRFPHPPPALPSTPDLILPLFIIPTGPIHLIPHQRYLPQQISSSYHSLPSFIPQTQPPPSTHSTTPRNGRPSSHLSLTHLRVSARPAPKYHTATLHLQTQGTISTQTKSITEYLKRLA